MFESQFWAKLTIFLTQNREKQSLSYSILRSIIRGSKSFSAKQHNQAQNHNMLCVCLTTPTQNSFVCMLRPLFGWSTKATDGKWHRHRCNVSEFQKNSYKSYRIGSASMSLLFLTLGAGGISENLELIGYPAVLQFLGLCGYFLKIGKKPFLAISNPFWRRNSDSITFKKLTKHTYVKNLSHLWRFWIIGL